MTVDLRTGLAHDSGGRLDACADPSPIELTLELAQPQWQSCPWGEDDNLAAADKTVTARLEEDLGPSLAATVCGLALAEVVPNYNDGFFLLLGDAVLATSHADLLEALEVQDGLPRYDWSRLAGQTFSDEDEEGWCLGQDEGSDCEVPRSMTEDPMRLELSSDGLQRLTGPLELTWVTFGDEDYGFDCSHEDMDLVLELQAGG